VRVKFFQTSLQLDVLEEKVNGYIEDYLKKGGDPEVYDVRLTTDGGLRIATIFYYISFKL